MLTSLNLAISPELAVRDRNSRVRAQRAAIRASYEFGGTNRLLSDFISHTRTFDDELRNGSLERLRNRCRELARNDHNAVKYLSLLVKNVIGSEGIKLQPQVKMQRGGNMNKAQNEIITDAWADWGEKENCTLTQKFTWITVQQLVLRTVAEDGEVFIRKLYRPDNPHRFTLQFIEASQVDECYNALLPNGNRVIMGIEFDTNSRPVAYHIFNRPRGDSFQPNVRLRVASDEILHIYRPVSLYQARGVPWMVAAGFQMSMFKDYQEAELVAARVGASQMGVITKQLDPNATLDPNAPQPDASGRVPIDLQPGSFAALAEGETLTMFDPKHPVAAYDAFCKACSRAIANGLDTSYMSLSGDLSSTSYSSARVGLLDERATYEMLQTWMIEDLCEPVYKEWSFQSAFSYMKQLATTSLDFKPLWHPKSFPWVDPEKDANAEIIKIDNGLTTRTRVLAALGYDFRETVDELADEEAYLKEKGVTLAAPIAPAAPKTPTLDRPTQNTPAGAPSNSGAQPAVPAGPAAHLSLLKM